MYLTGLTSGLLNSFIILDEKYKLNIKINKVILPVVRIIYL